MIYSTKIKINGVEILEGGGVSAPSLSSVELLDVVSQNGLEIGAAASSRIKVVINNPHKSSFDGDKVELYISETDDGETTKKEQIEEEVGDSATTELIDTSEEIYTEEPDEEEGEPLTDDEIAEVDAYSAELVDLQIQFLEGEPMEIEDTETAEEEDSEWELIGTYWVRSQASSDDTGRLTCYDNISRLNMQYSQAETPQTFSDHWQAIKVELAEYGIELDDYESTDSTLLQMLPLTTMRDALSLLAGYAGGFLSCAPDGSLGISFYGYTGEIIIRDDLISISDTSSGEIVVDAIECEDGYGNIITAGGGGQAVRMRNYLVTPEVLESVHVPLYRGTRYTGGAMTCKWTRELTAGEFIRVMTSEEYANYLMLLNSEEDTRALRSSLGSVLLISSQTIRFGGTATSVIYSACDSESAKEQYTQTPIQKQIINTDKKAKNAIKNVDVEYYLSTSATTLSGGSWQTAAPTWVDGKYMWSRTKATKGDGTVSYSPDENGTCIAGATGSTGATGTGVASITEEYYLSTSKTTQTGGYWTTTPPTWENGKYIWTRSKIVYTNPSSTKYTKPICDSSWEAAKDSIDNLEIGGRNLIIGSEKGVVNPRADTSDAANVKFQIYNNNTYVGQEFAFGVTKGEHIEYTYTSKYTGNRIRIGDSGVSTDGTEFFFVSEYKKGISYTCSFDVIDDRPNVVGGYVLKNIKLEKGNKATDWTPAPEDVQDAIDEAAKTATDFIKPQSTSMTDDGIKIFPKSEKDNPQNYAQINQQGMQIYKDGQRAASFGSEKISLGENSEQSVLEMCGGLTNLSSEVKVDEFGNKIGYILLAPTERAQSKDYPFRCGIASGKRDATIYLGDAECSMDTHLTPGGAASINIIQSEISGSSEFDLDGPHAFTRMGMHAVMGLTNGNEPGAGISVNAYLNGSTVESLLEMYADKITIDGEPLADFVVARGTSGLWTYEKWNSGKAVAYMPKFYEYSNLTMKAAGKLYMSEERQLTLPSGLFINTEYIVSHEIRSAGGPVSVVRQYGCTNAKFLFKIYKVYNSNTGVALKFRVKGRWK